MDRLQHQSVTFPEAVRITGMNSQDAKAMFELELELRDLAAGRRPRITSDEVIEVAAVLSRHQGDLSSLLRAWPSR